MIFAAFALITITDILPDIVSFLKGGNQIKVVISCPWGRLTDLSVTGTEPNAPLLRTRGRRGPKHWPGHSRWRKFTFPVVHDRFPCTCLRHRATGMIFLRDFVLHLPYVGEDHDP